MGANVIEEMPKVIQSVLQSGWAVNVDLPHEWFDATKEALDAAVAPRGTNRDALVTNADQRQERLEHSAFEDQFVVGSYGTRFAMLADGQAQMANQCPAALVGHRRQLRADARTVIDDAQNGAWCAMVVLHKCQVNAPDAVDTHRRRALVAQLASDDEQRVLVVADGVADKGFAHPSRGMQAVEGVSHLAATSVLAHQGFEAQDFLHNPVRLLARLWGRGVKRCLVRKRPSCKALALLPVEVIGQTSQGEEHWCYEQNRDQHEEPNEHGQKVPDYGGRHLLWSVGPVGTLRLETPPYASVNKVTGIRRNASDVI